MKPASKMQIWLSAGLFPLKVYAVLAGLWLVIWHSRLPPNWVTSLRPPEIDHRWELATGDFSAVAHLILPGYLIVATILLLGGSYQLYSGFGRRGLSASRSPSSLWSWVFS
jgi:hypothetical protein